MKVTRFNGPNTVESPKAFVRIALRNNGAVVLPTRMRPNELDAVGAGSLIEANRQGTETAASDGIVLHCRLERDPFELGELVDDGTPVEPSVAAVLRAAIRCLGFVLHRGPIDMTRTSLYLKRHLHRARDVATEDCRGQAIRGV